MSYVPRPGSVAERLVNLILAKPAGIRTATLAAEAGVDIENVAGNLQTAISHGLVTACKVEVPGRRAEKEYRPGPGRPPVSETKDYTPPRATIVVRMRDTDSSATRQPQPAVGQNTGSPEVDTQPPSADRAEPRPTATPVPKPKGRGMGPAAASVPAAERPTRPPRPYFAADTNGQLVIDLPRLDAPVVLDGSEHYALREFIQATPGLLWKENT